MALLCYNKGCGLKFDANKNNEDSCIFHPGIPIFHDALKGWSCCKKRTTDFSEFLSIKGCTRGCHSNEKPQEPLLPEVSSDKGQTKHSNGLEIIFQGPKSAEKMQKERPSSDEPKTKLSHKVSASLTQALNKLDISVRAEQEKRESQTIQGTRCKNAACKTVYQGPETDLEVCTHHPGGPVFHEGYKYWSCCCIKTMDFNAFLDQKGCTTGKHRWVAKQDKKKVACRHDWHQTGNNVVVTIYAKNANPEFTCIEANRTVLSCQIQFENDKIFKRDFHLWGVVEVKQSCVNMVASKVEVSLRKADAVSWGKLEDPNYKPEPEAAPAAAAAPQAQEPEPARPDWDIDDDDISDSDEEWAYDTAPKKKTAEEKEQQERRKKEELDLKRKEVQEEMKRALEDQRQAESQKEEQRRQEEEAGYEEMPDLE